jgi:hypothetical protein
MTPHRLPGATLRAGLASSPCGPSCRHRHARWQRLRPLCFTPSLPSSSPFPSLHFLPLLFHVVVRSPPAADLPLPAQIQPYPRVDLVLVAADSVPGGAAVPH